MKVLLFSRYPRSADKPRGGVEAVTVILARALAGMDDMKVCLVALDPTVRAPFLEGDAGVEVHRLPASSWPQMADILFGPGRTRLIKKIRSLTPDVVHSHETFGLTLHHIGCPHLFTVHGFDHANIPVEKSRFPRLRSLLWRAVEKYGLSRQSDIVSISPYVRAMIEPMTHARIYEIDNPVDERYFRVDSRRRQNRILCLGWINERKNTLGSVEAFGRALGEGHRATLVIAGEAQRETYLELVRRRVEALGIQDRVEFAGHVNREQLALELSRARIMLLPSFQENAPMAIAEAMAAGVPVIASNRCGMPYMVEEGKSGFLVEPEDTVQIADRLVRLLESESLCDSMGGRGRQIALDRFHPDAVARKTRGVYRMMLAHSRSDR